MLLDKICLKTFLAVVLLLCDCAVVRDREVYQAELAFFQFGMEEQADLLEAFLGDCCTCREGRWVDPVCEEAAQNVLVIRHRLGWHVSMMLYNANLSDERPAAEPPVVPESYTLCRGG